MTMVIKRNGGRPGCQGPAGISAEPHSPGPGPALAAALLGFFVITLDAVIVNVALPAIGRDFGSGMAGLQWVVDGVGGALAVAVFGALLARQATFMHGMRTSLLLAAGVALATAAASLALRPARQRSACARCPALRPGKRWPRHRVSSPAANA
jgi:DHA2 family methylenomycin A resistance protein-like MFS transporter